MSDWVLVENPAFTDETPRPLTPVCHDGTPFITARCACGYTMHIHESQVAAVPPSAEVASRCKGCFALLGFPPGFARPVDVRSGELRSGTA